MMAKDGSGWARESYLHRIGSYAESTATDHDEIREILRLAAAVLKGGKREPQIYSSDIYIELLYYAIQNMPYENEQFLLEKSTEFITVVPPGNERMLLKVYQILLEILYDHRRFSEAERKSGKCGPPSPEIAVRSFWDGSITSLRDFMMRS